VLGAAARQHVDDGDLHLGAPGVGQAQDRAAERVQLLAKTRRQDLFQLGQRALAGVSHPAHVAAGAVERDRHREAFVVLQHQRRQRSARAQHVATRRSGGRVHRVAQGAQAVDVAPERPVGDLQARLEVRTGPRRA
jgi:hypothetical protein